MHSAPVVSRTGLTLLEVLVALVILGLVGTGFLEIFAGSLRASARAREWAQALVYAELGQEAVGMGASGNNAYVSLGGGFTRHIALRRWREGVDRATVTIVLPDGARFQLDRLVPAQ